MYRYELHVELDDAGIHSDTKTREGWLELTRDDYDVMLKCNNGDWPF